MSYLILCILANFIVWLKSWTQLTMLHALLFLPLESNIHIFAGATM